MKKKIYRKLKDYICEEGITTTTIFGSLDSNDCKYYFDDKVYSPKKCYGGDYDFLLEYYVMGISPKYEIVDNRIVPYLLVTLQKEVE